MANRVSVPHGINLVRPWPVLERFVRYYADRNARLGDTVVVHPVHARAAPILDFKFGEDAILYIRSDGKPPLFSPRVVLIGMQTHRRGELHFRGTVDGFAIVFQPSALGLLFALPAQEFTDQDFDAEQVFGAIIARFHERLADCRTFEERISVANQFLLQRALAAPRLDGISAAAADILSAAGGARIPAMAGRAGLGLRQFERRFVQQVGLSPKLFARIARFEAALDRMARSPQGSWTEVAHRYGYYDQMHMVHDFSRFTGETPTRTLQHFEAAFERQMTAIRSGHAPPSQGERWVL
jgi:AraC-like DNA-binding protein